MATSSIGRDIQITDKKEAEELVEAMERAEKESKNMDYRERAKALEEDALRAQKILRQFDKMHDVTLFQGTIEQLKNVCIDKGSESMALYAKASREKQESVVVKTEPITINLNDQCTIVLTEEGAKILNQKADAWNNERGLFWMMKNDYSSGEEYGGSLWGLMHEFGHCMVVGTVPVFEKNKITITKDVYAGVQNNGYGR